MSTQLTAKENIRILYIDAINAAGGNNLTRTGKSCKVFFDTIKKLPDTKTVALKDFFKIFSDDINDFDRLFLYFCKGKETGLVNFGKKKAALFLRNLDLVQERPDETEKLFSNYKMDRLHLRIPVDIVITTVLNSILFSNRSPLDPGRDFDKINEFAYMVLGQDFMLIEDLWFWGYFNLKIIKGQEKPNVEFNEDKYFSANFIYPHTELESRLREFTKLITHVTHKM